MPGSKPSWSLHSVLRKNGRPRKRRRKLHSERSGAMRASRIRQLLEVLLCHLRKLRAHTYTRLIEIKDTSAKRQRDALRMLDSDGCLKRRRAGFLQPFYRVSREALSLKRTSVSYEGYASASSATGALLRRGSAWRKETLIAQRVSVGCLII